MKKEIWRDSKLHTGILTVLIYIVLALSVVRIVMWATMGVQWDTVDVVINIILCAVWAVLAGWFTNEWIRLRAKAQGKTAKKSKHSERGLAIILGVAALVWTVDVVIHFALGDGLNLTNIINTVTAAIWCFSFGKTLQNCLRNRKNKSGENN